MKITSADKVNGCLLRTDHDRWVFRVYDENYNIKDYEIFHSDLVITIDDTDAFFYEREDGRLVLDHSPETLGIDINHNNTMLSDDQLIKAFEYYCESDEGVLKFDYQLREEWKIQQLARWKEAFRKASIHE